MALVFSITLCVGVSLLFHLSEASNYFYYISYGFCVGVSGYYLIEETNSLLTPITYFGLSKICVLPNCFSSVFSETILPIANIGGGIIYLLVGIVLIFIIFYDFKYERE